MLTCPECGHTGEDFHPEDEAMSVIGVLECPECGFGDLEDAFE